MLPNFIGDERSVYCTFHIIHNETTSLHLSVKTINHGNPLAMFMSDFVLPKELLVESGLRY